MQEKMWLVIMLLAIFGTTMILPTSATETLSPEDFKQESWSKTIDFFDYARSYASTHGKTPPPADWHANLYMVYVNVSGFQLLYAGLMHACMHACMSSDSTGATKDTFDLGEDVYVTGVLFAPSTSYDIYVVDDVASWVDGMAVPSRVVGTSTSVSSNATGHIASTAVWNGPLVVGKYDIVVDVDGNGIYDEGIDALDDMDIQVTAGFNVVPEVPLGTIAASAAMIIALVAYVAVPKWRRKLI